MATEKSTLSLTATQLVKAALTRTESVARFVNTETRLKLAIAEVAILVDGMDESTNAAVRILRLSDAIAELRAQLPC